MHPHSLELIEFPRVAGAIAARATSPRATRALADAVPLSGAAEELRTLRVTLTSRGPTDLTIGFRTRNNTPDLGGRDRVHFLLDCLPTASVEER